MGTNGKEREEIPRDRGAVGRSRPTLALLALPDPSADSALDITPGFGVSLRAVQRVYVTRPPLVAAFSRRVCAWTVDPRPVGTVARGPRSAAPARAWTVV